jgi:hypothetical protein
MRTSSARSTARGFPLPAGHGAPRLDINARYQPRTTVSRSSS